jgi:hypothetical protein
MWMNDQLKCNHDSWAWHIASSEELQVHVLYVAVPCLVPPFVMITRGTMTHHRQLGFASDYAVKKRGKKKEERRKKNKERK